MIRLDEKKFDLPKMKGLSSEQIDIHLKLYAGYVKHSNMILEKLEHLSKNADSNLYEINELRKSLAFEMNGAKNHEYYFQSLEIGRKDLTNGSPFKKAIREEFGSFENWLEGLRKIAKTRGVGWVVLFYDSASRKFLNAWVEEHHIGNMNGLRPVFFLDMWEHAYLKDYDPDDKSKYVDAFFSNVNWEVVEENFKRAI